MVCCTTECSAAQQRDVVHIPPPRKLSQRISFQMFPLIPRCLVEWPSRPTQLHHPACRWLIWPHQNYEAATFALVGPRPLYCGSNMTKDILYSEVYKAPLADQNCASRTSSSVTWRFPHLSTDLGNTCSRSQQMGCLSELRLFIVSYWLHRKKWRTTELIVINEGTRPY